MVAVAASVAVGHGEIKRAKVVEVVASGAVGAVAVGHWDSGAPIKQIEAEIKLSWF